MKRNKAADTRVLLDKYGVDINDAVNGIPLGHPRPHNFTHRKDFLLTFRLPQFPGAVQWNGWAAERLVELASDQIEARLCWSGDPAAVPHPDPWGF